MVLKNKIYSLLILVLVAFNLNAQETSITKGLLLDEKTKSPLPYANVAILNKSGGTITNEIGNFSIDFSNIDKEDSLTFLFIGYKTKNISISDFKANPTIYLKEEIFNLAETFVFAEEKDPEQIIKKVLENKDKNYKKINKKNQVFIRSQYVSDIRHFKIKFKKSSFSKLDDKMTRLIESKIPKHSVSYSDFLGDLYFSNKSTDTLKVLPIKMVSLKEKDLADLKQLESMFEKMFKNTNEKEYWKVKSGIIGSKIDLEEETSDSLKKDKTPKFQAKYYRNGIQKRLNNLITNKKDWEFLHATNKYKYTLAGGTRFNGENVYIIDFEPDKNGKFIGRAYISMETYALVKANYEYAPGKIGTNINLLGVGYTKNMFSNSVSYEKENGRYKLKYYSQKDGEKTSIDRNVSLLKKKKRAFFDKKLNEIKVRLNVSVNSSSSKEYLVLSEDEISSKTYQNKKQPKYIKIIYVDQFDDKLWKGYSTIEPTKQMREYKKQDL
jgi:hypothetical protein